MKTTPNHFYLWNRFFIPNRSCLSASPLPPRREGEVIVVRVPLRAVPPVPLPNNLPLGKKKNICDNITVATRIWPLGPPLPVRTSTTELIQIRTKSNIYLENSFKSNESRIDCHIFCIDMHRM
jgi:hypothetical protein